MKVKKEFNINNNVFSKKMQFLKVQMILNQLDIKIKILIKVINFRPNYKKLPIKNKKIQIKI